MSQLVQAIVVGLVQGALYALIAAGFGLIMAVTKRFHFAIATTFVLAVFVAASLVEAGLPTLLAIAGGLAAGALSGVLIEWAVYEPIVRRAPESALLGVFVAALGVAIVGENAVRLIWGSKSRQIDPGFTPERLELGGDVGISNVDVLALVVCALLIVGLWLFLRRSAFGRSIRAVEENPDMAVAVGIDPRRIGWAVFAIGSVLASAAAMLFAMRSAVPPNAGQSPTFIALVIVFLAGLRSSPLRFGVVGLLIGVAESLGAVYISSGWSSVVVFGLLFVYIVSTPYLQGGLPRFVPRPRRRREAVS